MKRHYENLLFGLVMSLTVIPVSYGWDELWMPKESEWTEASEKQFQDFPHELKGRFQDRCENLLQTALERRPTHSEMSDCIDMVVDAFYANNSQPFNKTESAMADFEDQQDRYSDVPRQVKQATVRHCKDAFKKTLGGVWFMLNACIEQELRSYRKLQRDYGDVLGSSH